jgi:hypothetical protein
MRTFSVVYFAPQTVTAAEHVQKTIRKRSRPPRTFRKRSENDHGRRGRSENVLGRGERSETITAAAGVATSNPNQRACFAGLRSKDGRDDR